MLLYRDKFNPSLNSLVFSSTDFLILFFAEALFYCGVAIFLLLIDHLRRPVGPDSAAETWALHLGQRISYVATLVLSLIIPMVTMGLVWPWTGPPASATLAPYLVGIVVQFAFEQYARYLKSPSWPVIPIIFQVRAYLFCEPLTWSIDVFKFEFKSNLIILYMYTKITSIYM